MPPAWFSGVVDRVFKKSLSVHYGAEDLHATHSLDAWQVEHRTVPESVAAEADDSDDEVPLHISRFPDETAPWNNQKKTEIRPDLVR